MADRPVVLVTGAGGFIGGRVVEMLGASGLAEPVAAIRRWSSAARIARLGVRLAPCDLEQPAQVAAALAGVTHVIHCAVGSPGATVDGTANLLAAAREAGVRRVVHLSTIDVYGRERGEVTEDSPPTPTGAQYGDTKIRAEEACRAAMADGLEVTILRPTIVYGPFSALWTIEFAQRLQQRPWPFPEEHCGGTCNLVYVDDVVQAAWRALGHPAAPGEAFNVNGADWPTWYRYFVALHTALGLPPLEVQSAGVASLRAAVMAPVKRTAKFALRHFQPQIMGLYQRSALARRVMKRAESAMRSAPSTAEFRLYGRTATFPTGKAERLIGYRPAVGMARGVELSAAWLRHHGYVGGRPA